VPQSGTPCKSICGPRTRGFQSEHPVIPGADAKQPRTAQRGWPAKKFEGKAMKHRILCTGMAAAVAFGMVGSSAQAQIKIVFNSFAPPTFVFNQGMIDAWAKKVAQVTEGRVVVEIPATSLAPPQQQWEMVTQGVADGAYIFNGFALKRLLLPQLAHLPFATPTSEAQARALWRTQKKFFESANEYEGVQLIGYFGSPAPYLWAANNQKPFMAIDDLKGVKTWSPPGDNARALEKSAP
jgi:TRAP-type C4-dicarboxylate transport system substrate-binding protein